MTETQTDLTHTIAGCLELLSGAYPAFRPDDSSVLAWSRILAGEPPELVREAVLALASEPRAFPPTPGEVLWKILQGRAPSLRLPASEAWEMVAWDGESQRNLPTQVAIDCGALQRGAQQWEWWKPAEGPALTAVLRRFTEAWTSLPHAPERTRARVEALVQANRGQIGPAGSSSGAVPGLLSETACQYPWDRSASSEPHRASDGETPDPTP